MLIVPSTSYLKDDRRIIRGLCHLDGTYRYIVMMFKALVCYLKDSMYILGGLSAVMYTLLQGSTVFGTFY